MASSRDLIARRSVVLVVSLAVRVFCVCTFSSSHLGPFARPFVLANLSSQDTQVRIQVPRSQRYVHVHEHFAAMSTACAWRCKA